MTKAEVEHLKGLLAKARNNLAELATAFEQPGHISHPTGPDSEVAAMLREGCRALLDAAERVERLEGALRPFAEVADTIDAVGREHGDDDRVNIVQSYGCHLAELTEADFFAARALLVETADGGNDD